MVDMRKYGGGAIRPDDLRDGPRVEKIIEISENETHNCAVLHLASGDQLFCWASTARVLNRAWGFDSDDWLDQEIELSIGTYHDKKSDTEKEMVLVRAISPPKAEVGSGGPPAPRNDDMNDESPF